MKSTEDFLGEISIAIQSIARDLHSIWLAIDEDRGGREVIYPDEIPVDRAGCPMYNRYGDKLDIEDRQS